MEAKNKSSRRIGEGEIGEGSELRDERAGINEVKRMMLATEDGPIAGEVNDQETYFFIKKIREGK